MQCSVRTSLWESKLLLPLKPMKSISHWVFLAHICSLALLSEQANLSKCWHHTSNGRLLFLLPPQLCNTHPCQWPCLAKSLCTMPLLSELPVTLERPGDVTYTQAWAMTLHVRLDGAIGWILLYLPQKECSEIQKVVQMPLLRFIPARASSDALYKSTMGTVILLAIFSLLTFLPHPLLGIVLSNKPIAQELCCRICSLGDLVKNKRDEKFTFPGVACLLWYYRWIWSCVHLLSWKQEHSGVRISLLLILLQLWGLEGLQAKRCIF